MPVDDSLLGHPFHQDPSLDGVCVTRHPDGQLASVTSRQGGEVRARLDLDPDKLMGVLQEHSVFGVDEEVHEEGAVQYRQWVAHVLSGIEDDAHHIMRCGFCGKPSTAVARLIAGPTHSICNECVALCVEVLRT